jgi:hypothetical protein
MESALPIPNRTVSMFVSLWVIAAMYTIMMWNSASMNTSRSATTITPLEGLDVNSQEYQDAHEKRTRTISKSAFANRKALTTGQISPVRPDRRTHSARQPLPFCCSASR